MRAISGIFLSLMIVALPGAWPVRAQQVVLPGPGGPGCPGGDCGGQCCEPGHCGPICDKICIHADLHQCLTKVLDCPVYVGKTQKKDKEEKAYIPVPTCHVDPCTGHTHIEICPKEYKAKTTDACIDVRPPDTCLDKDLLINDLKIYIKRRPVCAPDCKH